MRFGDHGRYVPKAGEEIAVVYDPDDHEKVMVAAPKGLRRGGGANPARYCLGDVTVGPAGSE
jgi:hypothetical protein